MVLNPKNPLMQKSGLQKKGLIKTPHTHFADQERSPNASVPYRERYYSPPEVSLEPKEEIFSGGARKVLRGVDEDLEGERIREENEDNDRIGKKKEGGVSITFDGDDQPKRKSYEVNLGSDQIKTVADAVWQAFRQIFNK